MFQDTSKLKIPFFKKKCKLIDKYNFIINNKSIHEYLQTQFQNHYINEWISFSVFHTLEIYKTYANYISLMIKKEKICWQN